MGSERILSSFVGGVFMYPLLIIVGLIFSIITSGDFNFLFWLYMPSAMFSELFKKCCENIASNNKLILLSGFVFWFIIGAIIGLIVNFIKCSPVVSKKEIEIDEIRQEELKEQNKPKEEKSEENKEETKEEKAEEKSEEHKTEIKEENKEEVNVEVNKEKPKESKLPKLSKTKNKEKLKNKQKKKK